MMQIDHKSQQKKLVEASDVLMIDRNGKAQKEPQVIEMDIQKPQQLRGESSIERDRTERNKKSLWLVQPTVACHIEFKDIQEKQLWIAAIREQTHNLLQNANSALFANNRARRGTIKVEWDEDLKCWDAIEPAPAFAERISIEEFERQKLHFTEQQISVLRDTNCILSV